jgi:hypothetical protein
MAASVVVGSLLVGGFLLLGATLLAGCSHGAGGLRDEHPAERDEPPWGVGPEDTQGLPRLGITLMPRAAPTAGIAVFLDLRAPDLSQVRALRMAPEGPVTGVPANVRFMLLRDGDGVIDFEYHEKSGRFVFERPVRGPRLRVSYLAEPNFQSGRLGLSVTADSVWGAGYGFLALPEIGGPLSARLRWSLGGSEARVAASSWGHGTEAAARATVVELHEALYLAGDLTVVEAPNGNRLIARGQPRFDLNEALGFCSTMLRVARERFEPDDEEPVTFVVVPEPGLGSRNDGIALHRALAVWFDANRPLDDRLRLLLTHELLHRWIGNTLRFVGPDGEDARWFSEGFTVHLARSLLVHEGLIEPGHYVRDVYRDLQSQIATELREDGQLARRFAAFVSAASQTHAAPDYARGALYAARLEAQLVDAGLGGLDALLLPLLAEARGAEARASRRPMPVAVWRDAVVQALGPGAGDEAERFVLWQSEPVDLPDSVLQPWLRLAGTRR